MLRAGILHRAVFSYSWRRRRVMSLQKKNIKNSGMRPASLPSNHPPWITRSLSTQGTLLKVVLDDYMRLKKLFAQRMVHKATASQGDRSSVSEVEGCAWAWGGACRALWDAVCPPGHTACGPCHPVVPPLPASSKQARYQFSTGSQCCFFTGFPGCVFCTVTPRVCSDQQQHLLPWSF